MQEEICPQLAITVFHNFPLFPFMLSQLPTQCITHLIARFQIQLIGMPRLEVVEYNVQIGGQQTMRFLEIGKTLEGAANKQHAT